MPNSIRPCESREWVQSLSAKSCVLVTSPSPRTALGPVVWLQGEAGSTWPRLDLQVGSCISKRTNMDNPCFLSGFAAPYTALHTLHRGGHTCTHSYHTDTHTQTYAMHTTYRSTHHTQKPVSIWLCNCPAHSGIRESCRFVVTVHFNWDSHTYPLCSAQTSDPDLDWPLFHLIHNSRAARWNTGHPVMSEFLKKTTTTTKLIQVWPKYCLVDILIPNVICSWPEIQI